MRKVECLVNVCECKCIVSGMSRALEAKSQGLEAVLEELEAR